MSHAKRLLVCAALVLSMIVAITGGSAVARALFGARHVAPGGSGAGVAFVLMLALGGVSMLLGCVSYALVLATNCFTFDYRRPVWRNGFTVRLWFANVFVPLFFLVGIGAGISSVMAPLLMALGVDDYAALMLPFFGTILPCQIGLAWFCPWTPVAISLIHRRLRELGISDQEAQCAFPVGISDPTRSSMGKLGLIEDDVGMLWLLPEKLYYRGDASEFEIDRGDFLGVDRGVDRGSVAAYCGARDVIIYWRDCYGRCCCTRLHVEDRWTLTGTAHGQDELAWTLDAWWSGTSEPVPC